MQTLQRDFLIDEFEQELSLNGVQGAVTVQARQTLEETLWLLRLAQHSRIIRGVVGWAPIALKGFEQKFEEVLNNPKLVGLRHVVQGEAPGFLDGADFNYGIAALKSSGLTYDLLIVDHQSPEAIRFVDRHADQPFILDHMAKPPITKAQLEPWRMNMQELARRPNVSCKISGLVTEASWEGWSLDDLRPFLDTVVDSFGPSRLMAGSDWPVCLLASSYKEWWNALRKYFSDLSATEQAQIFGETATRTYGLTS